MSKKSKRLRKMRRDAEAAFKSQAPAPVPAASKTYSTGWDTLKCSHYADSPVFQVGKIRVFATTSNIARWIKDAAFLINCSDFGHNRDVLQVPGGFESLYAYGTAIPMLSIPWPDGGAPAVKPQFWNALAKLLTAKVEGDVIVYCLGSHGRTGTALACLRLQFAPFVTAQEAIDCVRMAHCSEAIETKSQVDYIYSAALATGGLDMVQDKGKRPLGALETETFSLLKAEQAALTSPSVPHDDIEEIVLASDDDFSEKPDSDGPNYERDNGNAMLGAWSDVSPSDTK